MTMHHKGHWMGRVYRVFGIALLAATMAGIGQAQEGWIDVQGGFSATLEPAISQGGGTGLQGFSETLEVKVGFDTADAPEERKRIEVYSTLPAVIEVTSVEYQSGSVDNWTLSTGGQVDENGLTLVRGLVPNDQEDYVFLVTIAGHWHDGLFLSPEGTYNLGFRLVDDNTVPVELDLSEVFDQLDCMRDPAVCGNGD